MNRRYWLLLGWLLCSIFGVRFTISAQTPSVERIPAPDWVKPFAVDFAGPTSREQSSDGIYPLLHDEQVHAGEHIRYFHFARKLLSENGVQEGSRVTLSFDPAYESVALHRLTVHRDGKELDRMSGQEIKLLQREQRLDRHSYDGRLSAVMLLEDTRVGDTIEFAYSIRGENPIFNGRFFDLFSLRWSTPLHQFHYRLLWPNARKFTYKSLGEAFEPKITETGSLTVYSWEQNDPPPIIADTDLPKWFDPFGWFQLSEFQSWRDVAQWAAQVYVVSDTVPEELRKQIDEIARIDGQKAQAVAALRFVQSNIRYLGMEIGVHSYKPYPLETVLKRRFGDCKDKTLVLCAMLRQLGMDACPALVETAYRHTISEWLPSPSFDHLVVHLRLGGRSYWLDPTMSYQGGQLDQLYFPNYGKALLVSDQTTSLTEITPGGDDVTGMEVTNEYEVGNFEGEMNLQVHTVYRGMEADRTRSWLADTSRAELEKGYLNYYAKRYPAIRAVSSPHFTDDLEKNEITSEERYLISNFWQPRGKEREKLYGEFSAETLSDRIIEPQTHVRSMPLGLAYPRNVTETIRVSFPKPIRLTEENVSVKDPAFAFSYVRTKEANSVTLRYHYETAADHVAAPRTAEYLSKVREVRDSLDYTIWIPAKDLRLTPEKKPERLLTFGGGGDKVDAEKPPSIVKGFLLAPFLLVGCVGVVWVVRRYRPSNGNQHFGEPVHCCCVCGVTEQASPDLEFRVAADGREYCRPHLPNK